VGIEEEAVFSLLRRVDERYRIRSAFTRGSIRGWVYLEAHMDTDIIQLLRHTPGIILNQQGVVRQGVDISDWTKLLMVTTPSEIFKPKQWVRVCKGMYRGDIGFIIRTESWGVEVLLIPRLQSSSVKLAPPSKRKRTKIPPQPALLDRFVLERSYVIEPTEKLGDYFTLHGLKFEHGLLRKSFDSHSIKADVLSMPSHYIHIFKFCCHPALDGCTFPRPQEWMFEEGEQVVVRSSRRKAQVAAITPDHLEVDFGENETQRCPWDDVWKAVEVGDFVIVTSGLHRGETGFVDWVRDDEVNLVEKQAEGSGMVRDHSAALRV
jgi:transcription antitermination factor NusG